MVDGLASRCTCVGALLAVAAICAGCQASRPASRSAPAAAVASSGATSFTEGEAGRPTAAPPAIPDRAADPDTGVEPASHAADRQEATVRTALAEEPSSSSDDEALLPLPPAEEIPGSLSTPRLAQPEAVAGLLPEQVTVGDVVRSVRANFPLIQAAAAARTIAAGETLSAWGAFDHKIEGESVSQPLSYYENYRQGLGVKRDTYLGGQLLAGYRVGRGDFEPWYQERPTNDGGEFKAGFMAPIVRDRWIDANRAALWQAQLERNRVEPEIRAQLILFVRDGATAYWIWVAAGADYRIAREQLDLAQQRQEALEEQVEAAEKAAINLVDNRRIIVSREAKQIDAERKLRQSAVKLSLFYRDEAGVPLVLDANGAPPPFPQPPDELALDAGDVSQALATRPELADLSLQRQKLEVALRQAENERLPDVDAGLLVSQDVGAPTSAKRDKSPAELQALVTLSYAAEQRKAQGKARATRGKLAQLQAKARFVEDKIAAEVRNARLALQAARERVTRARESSELAERMLVAERDLFADGQSTLLNLFLREGQVADAASDLVLANLEFQLARADYAAALGLEGLPEPAANDE